MLRACEQPPNRAPVPDREYANRVSLRIGLRHDDFLLINFTTKTRIQNANVSQRIAIEKNTSMESERSVQIVHGSEAWW